jgi:putative flippase GtrA
MSKIIKKSQWLELYKKYKEIFWYLVFGVLTTVVSFVFYYGLNAIFGEHTLVCKIRFYWISFDIEFYLVSQIISWIFAVLFAYVTNRKYVFSDKSAHILKECGAFYVSRISTGIAETVIMYVFVSGLGFDDKIIKIVATVVVICLNYALSKFFVFKKGKV